MKIRNKILIYFSTTIIVLLGVSLGAIFIIFSEYREEEFQQKQNTKILQTLFQLTKFEDYSKELAGIMDELTIHDFYDEKMLIFDTQKDLIFSSIDDLSITNYSIILNELSPANRWIETKVGNYDVVGVYVQHDNAGYYGISKAFDESGYSKIYFLGNVLSGIFIFMSAIVLAISLYLSKKIAKPITELSERLNRFDLGDTNTEELPVNESSYELKHLTERFNQLFKKTNEAFLFQKHTINHISHELKTPITILVSELETLLTYNDLDALKPVLNTQIQSAKSLGDIINILLELSKFEAGQTIKKKPLRIDDLIFDVVSELNSIHPDFIFDINYNSTLIDEHTLMIHANEMLIKQAFQNLLSNAITYGDTKQSSIVFDIVDGNNLSIKIINSGYVISKFEEKYVFNYFFRGTNSKGKMGFGLGLVLTKKILEVNHAVISYASSKNNLNIFEVKFPLS